MPKETQGIKFNLDEYDESLVQEVVEINPDSNPMEGPAPVDDGIHRFKLFINPESFEKSSYTTKQGQTVDFIKCQFYGVCQDEGGKNNNKRIFGRENTITFDGKNKMAYILGKLYEHDPNGKAYIRGLDNYVKLAKAFKQALLAEPIIKVKTEWQATYKDPKTAEGTKAKYLTAKSGQKNFPQNGDGTYRATVEVPGVGEVKAQAVALDYFSDNV